MEKYFKENRNIQIPKRSKRHMQKKKKILYYAEISLEENEMR